MTLDDFVCSMYKGALSKEYIKQGLLHALRRTIERVEEVPADEICDDLKAILSPMVDLEGDDFYGTEGMLL